MTIYRKVKVAEQDDRFKTILAEFITDGRTRYVSTNLHMCESLRMFTGHYLEEIEVPTEEKDIEKELENMPFRSYSWNSFRQGLIFGANYILNKIKGEK